VSEANQVEHSETRMQGQAFLLTFAATGKSETPSRAEQMPSAIHANRLNDKK
jgi:hypothetical protein